MHWVLSRAAYTSCLTSSPWSLTWQCHTTSHLPQSTNASFQFPHDTAAESYQSQSPPS